MSRRSQSASPLRTCVGCAARDRQPAMIRLRREGERVVVAVGRPAGRSAYVHARPECIGGLARSRFLGRSLRADVGRESRAELIRVLDGQLSSGSLTVSCFGHGATTRSQAGTVPPDARK